MRVIVSRQMRSAGDKGMRLSALFLAAALLVAGFTVVYSVFGGERASTAVDLQPEAAEVSAQVPASSRSPDPESVAVSAILGTLQTFGARSTEEAANIWAEGVSARNGLTQYAVMTDALKEKYLELIEAGDGFLFPTGASRVESWQINEISEDEDGVVTVRLTFSLEGTEAESAAAELTIDNANDYAAVSSVAVEEPLYEFTGIG